MLFDVMLIWGCDHRIMTASLLLLFLQNLLDSLLFVFLSDVVYIFHCEVGGSCRHLSSIADVLRDGGLECGTPRNWLPIWWEFLNLAWAIRRTSLFKTTSLILLRHSIDLAFKIAVWSTGQIHQERLFEIFSCQSCGRDIATILRQNA